MQDSPSYRVVEVPAHAERQHHTDDTSDTASTTYVVITISHSSVLVEVSESVLLYDCPVVRETIVDARHPHRVRTIYHLELHIGFAAEQVAFKGLDIHFALVFEDDGSFFLSLLRPFGNVRLIEIPIVDEAFNGYWFLCCFHFVILCSIEQLS